MIKAQDIIDKRERSMLSISEAEAVEQLEELTDNAITEQFLNNHSISIDDNLIDKIVAPFGIWRKTAIKNAWKKRYEENGWSVQYNDNQACYWTLTARQK